MRSIRSTVARNTSSMTSGSNSTHTSPRAYQSSTTATESKGSKGRESVDRSRRLSGNQAKLPAASSTSTASSQPAAQVGSSQHKSSHGMQKQQQSAHRFAQSASNITSDADANDNRQERHSRSLPSMPEQSFHVSLQQDEEEEDEYGQHVALGVSPPAGSHLYRDRSSDRALRVSSSSTRQSEVESLIAVLRREGFMSGEDDEESQSEDSNKPIPKSSSWAAFATAWLLPSSASGSALDKMNQATAASVPETEGMTETSAKPTVQPADGTGILRPIPQRRVGTIPVSRSTGALSSMIEELEHKKHKDEKERRREERLREKALEHLRNERRRKHQQQQRARQQQQQSAASSFEPVSSSSPSYSLSSSVGTGTLPAERRFGAEIESAPFFFDVLRDANTEAASSPSTNAQSASRGTSNLTSNNISSTTPEKSRKTTDTEPFQAPTPKRSSNSNERRRHSATETETETKNRSATTRDRTGQSANPSLPASTSGSTSNHHPPKRRASQPKTGSQSQQQGNNFTPDCLPS